MQRFPYVFLALVLATSACVGKVEESQRQGQPVPTTDSGFVPVDAGPPVQVPAVVDSGARDTGAVIPVSPADGGPVQPRNDAGGQVVTDAGMTAPGDASVTIGEGNPCGTSPEPLAANLKVRELSIYQTVKVPLYKDSAWVTTRNATIVQGKKSLVRAFVDTQTGFTPRALRAVLTLDNEGKKTSISSERTIKAASTDEAADSTFDFAVDGALIGAGTQLSVSVLETTCVAPNTAGGARVPATGAQALNATSIAKLRVVIVPVTVGGRTPDTGEAQLTKYRDYLRAYYPVADVEVTAHEPIEWTRTIAASGTGWAELLNQIGRERQADSPAGSVYYFGVMTPAASFRDYCRTSCVLGLAPQTTFVSRANQIGLGVGFVDENTYSTCVHELGHAHGLPHAPCVPRGGSIQGADTKFPYAGAKIGSWGWDSRSAKLMSPATYVDVMSYCDPTWISDYNYEKIATRSKAVNSAMRVFSADASAESTWHGIILSAGAGARWSGMTLDELPGEPTTARALDAQGDLVAEISVVRIALDHSDDAFLYIPDPDRSWAAIDLGDRTLVLDQIAPALD